LYEFDRVKKKHPTRFNRQSFIGHQTELKANTITEPVYLSARKSFRRMKIQWLHQLVLSN